MSHGGESHHMDDGPDMEKNKLGDDDDLEEDDDDMTTSQHSRDTIINPFWIEDKQLGRGPVDYLSGAEITFWKDLIEKYLHPLDANKAQQVKKMLLCVFQRFFRLLLPPPEKKTARS